MPRKQVSNKEFARVVALVSKDRSYANVDSLRAHLRRNDSACNKLNSRSITDLAKRLLRHFSSLNQDDIQHDNSQREGEVNEGYAYSCYHAAGLQQDDLGPLYSVEDAVVLHGPVGSLHTPDIEMEDVSDQVPSKLGHRTLSLEEEATLDGMSIPGHILLNGSRFKQYEIEF
ncbi:hypothetical protein HBI24_196530 [Parastagonospora nodorum]|nr:hypothetical protein HBH42_050660 [Parastagonospora nodorum]KAH5083822.1 hypothetical protein HBH95_037400 [Parastagonospora nodorum]KAH5361533.1 hypothetical protein HBI33_191970 [Parastagonospora nodorum]KAH5574593.1 hypothetical protein HBI24_196530 [Parastagonospora nodorum]KAH5717412.1 hypothetical protein HBI20_124910 [Parastagonospora nodorum]